MARTAPPNADFVLDTWSALSHKAGIGDGQVSPDSRLAPMWVGEHARRLTAYRILQAYIDNVSRHFVSSADPTDRSDHREYGDGALLRDAIRDALLGDRQEIVVDGAATYDPELEEEEGQPSDNGPKTFSGDVTSPEPDQPDVTPPTAEELADNAEAKSAKDREEWLRDWADDDDFAERVQETETCATGLGDGVYVLAWDEAERRVCVVEDFRGNAGFYFPVRSARFNQRKPTRVHLASEVEIDAQGVVSQVSTGTAGTSGSKRYVHRITYELIDLPDGETRDYAWLADDAPPSTKTCLMTEGYWELREAKSSLDFAGPAARYETFVDTDGVEKPRRDHDLAIDFIPVVHIRNTPGDDWGQSSLARVAQILDDLSYTDTDLARAAPIVGVPPVWSAGNLIAGGEVDTYGPGTWIRMGESGSAGVLDTSSALAALNDLVERLRERLSVNARVPQSVLGRVSGGAESGIHLALTFGPLSSMVGQMRLVRKSPYSEFFDMVQKLAMAAGELEAGVPHHAEMAFGSYLPVDKTSVVEQVTRLLGAKAISRELALRLLTDAGFPVEEAAAEIARIEASDFEGAVALLDATNDDGLVFEYLQRQRTQPAAPEPPVPPPGGLAPRLGPEPAPTAGIGAQPAPGGTGRPPLQAS